MVPRPAISAHATAPATSRATLTAALASGAEFVELDVQRCRDGGFVVHHDDGVHEWTAAEVVATTGALPLDEAVALLAGRARVHVDLKSETGEVAAVRAVLDAVPASDVVVTSLEDATVRRLRDWADAEAPDLRVGLTLGREVRGRPVHRQATTRATELTPAARLRRCRADLVAAHHLIARLAAARVARRLGLPLVVWTVDDDAALRRWLAPGRARLVVSNRPERALALRAEALGSPP